MYWCNCFVNCRNTIRDRHLESTRTSARTLSIQITEHWIHEQEWDHRCEVKIFSLIWQNVYSHFSSIPSKYWRSERNSLLRCHKSSLDSALWSLQYFWIVSSAIVSLFKCESHMIFDEFAIFRLTYPNPIDPLNGDAAAMYLHKPEEYKKKVTGQLHLYDDLFKFISHRWYLQIT